MALTKESLGKTKTPKEGGEPGLKTTATYKQIKHPPIRLSTAIGGHVRRNTH
jgi:hypothetical protein